MDPQKDQTTKAPAVIGWEQKTAVPDGYRFNDYLSAANGRLLFDGLDLGQLLAGSAGHPGLERILSGPLEIVYLPLIRQEIARMNDVFARAAAAVGYNGRFLYAYASKANAAEEVIRTTLGAGAHHEMSSTVDTDIARQMLRRGLLPADRLIVCNGFKTPGSAYMDNIMRLRDEHEQVIPVIEDLDELRRCWPTAVALMWACARRPTATT